MAAGLVSRSGKDVGWREESTKTEYYKQQAQAIEAKTIPGWLSLDRQEMIGQVLTPPTPDDIDAKFNGKAIVEHYSR